MQIKRNSNIKSVLKFFGAGACLATLVGFSSFSPLSYDLKFWQHDTAATETLRELQRLSVLEYLPQSAVEELLKYQQSTGKSLAEVLKDPAWSKKLGLFSMPFKATWYMANPYDVLPPDLQRAIRDKKEPFKSTRDVWAWCKALNAPDHWRASLQQAFIETTPENLWRAGRGERPFTKNGEFLEPIVIDRGSDILEVRDGHIATDPNIIPTNSDVILLVKIQGEERVLKVKAADVGAAIKGFHVDLPIHLGPQAARFPNTLFPAQHIRNISVKILIPLQKIEQVRVSPGQKGEADFL